MTKRWMIVAALLLSACSDKPTVDPRFTTEGKQFWSDYSKRMQGKCFRRWDDQEMVISIDKFNNDPAWVAICYLSKACDYQNKSKCVTTKICSSFSHGSMLYDNIQKNHYLEHECGKTK